ncbi:hypothetical protein THICB2_230081 [Thiomonas sp. CB2]|nr:hypothetical protein THICB2_230081 [Thiomonas sp. CB2]VDY05636.1 protein of unknown function [Thiomonas sp. Bio17B3]VDY07197.1 protein of unknown function [Thiomonas sp. Sup16B3]VDY16908.1 protein of unknown function [Thiomonas sp. CB2]
MAAASAGPAARCPRAAGPRHARSQQRRASPPRKLGRRRSRRGPPLASPRRLHLDDPRPHPPPAQPLARRPTTASPLRLGLRRRPQRAAPHTSPLALRPGPRPRSQHPTLRLRPFHPPPALRLGVLLHRLIQKIPFVGRRRPFVGKSAHESLAALKIVAIIWIHLNRPLTNIAERPTRHAPPRPT